MSTRSNDIDKQSRRPLQILTGQCISRLSTADVA